MFRECHHPAVSVTIHVNSITGWARCGAHHLVSQAQCKYCTPAGPPPHKLAMAVRFEQVNHAANPSLVRSWAQRHNPQKANLDGEKEEGSPRSHSVRILVVACCGLSDRPPSSTTRLATGRCSKTARQIAGFCKRTPSPESPLIERSQWFLLHGHLHQKQNRT